MWVEQVKTGFKYIERYTDPMTGKYKRVSVVLEKDTAQARKTAQRVLNTKIDEAMCPQEKKITLTRLVDAYHKSQEHTVKPQTAERNLSACRSIMSMLGENTYVDKLSAGYVRERFLASGRENGTLNEWLTRFKALIRWGYRNDYITDISFLEKLEKFPDVPHKVKIEDKFLESDELNKLIASMKVTKWKVLTQFLALSGLRFGEAAALERSDIDLKERVIHVTKTYNQAHDIVSTPKTIDSNRDVYIQDELLPICKTALALSLCDSVIRMSKVLFPGSRREHIQFDMYAKYLRENSERVLGRKITPHTLRHTHVSLMIEQGISLDAVSRRVGHSDSRITREIYMHVTNRLKEKENNMIREVKIL
mgnify:FL=1